jgi:hypothetical protein
MGGSEGGSEGGKERERGRMQRERMSISDLIWIFG